MRNHILPPLVVLASLLLPGASAAEDTGGPKPEAFVRRIKAQTDKAPDCSSLKAAVESVTRDCKTNDEKAIAIYNFMLLTHYHRAYPSEPGGVGALKEINVYGWSLCGGLHSVESALWREVGWEWRFVGWPGHTTVEAKYDGRWHYLDVFLKYYAWMPDPNAPGGRTIAGEDDIKANPALVTEGLEHDKGRAVYYHKGNKFENIGDKANWRAPALLVCGDDPPGIIEGTKASNVSGSPTGWAGIEFDSPGYSTDVNLAPGSSLTLTWDAIPGAHWWNGRKDVPGHTCGDKDYRNCPAIGPVLEPYRATGGAKRSYANGKLVFAPDFSNAAFLKGLAAQENAKYENGQLVPADPAAPASITVALSTPYIMTRATAQADGVEAATLSVDGGKTFKPVQLKDFSDDVGGQYAALLKLSFKALKSLNVEVIVQCNRCALPYLSPGANKVSVAVAEPKDLGENLLVVTYAYQPGVRTKSYEQLADMGAEVGKAHAATWSATPVVVQKTFRAADLPAEFEIPVPTPKDKYPVYPRMLFLRREVLTPGGKPMPLPEGAVEPKVGADDELKTLPSPFTVGMGTPPTPVVRKTATQKIELSASHAVSQDGKVELNHYMKWKEGETWAVLVGGEVKDLPPAKRIAAARLVFPVLRATAKASTKAGATLLGAPIEAGKPYDFKNLGDVIGSTVLPKQEADYAPPKAFAIDVTRAVRALASGEAKFNGFALRTIPDRGVDEGYTVRFDLPTGAKLQLEVDVYEE